MPEIASSLKCPKCSFVGKSAQSLKVHIGRAHGAKKRAKRRGRKANACPTCGQGFKTPAALKAHITRFHSGRPGKAAAKRTGRMSSFDRDMQQLPLSAIADLYEACQRELQRRLGP
jgi:uncharacterized C2H2 Zn-finger protein